MEIAGWVRCSSSAARAKLGYRQAITKICNCRKVSERMKFTVGGHPANLRYAVRLKRSNQHIKLTKAPGIKRCHAHFAFVACCPLATNEHNEHVSGSHVAHSPPCPVPSCRAAGTGFVTPPDNSAFHFAADAQNRCSNPAPPYE